MWEEEEKEEEDTKEKQRSNFVSDLSSINKTDDAWQVMGKEEGHIGREEQII